LKTLSSLPDFVKVQGSTLLIPDDYLRQPGDDDGVVLPSFDPGWFESEPWEKVPPVQPDLPLEKGLLGKEWEITSPPPEDVENDSVFLRARKWARQSVYRKIINTKSANFCHRAKAPLITPGGLLVARKFVDVRKSKDDRFSYGGLITCGSIWLCPVCSSKISEQRRIELGAALRVADEQGLTVLHLTLTAPHHLGEKVDDLLDGMAYSRRLMQKRKPWIRLSSDLGMIGNIRGLEVTHGWINGWHVHFHVLLFMSRQFKPETKEQSLKNLESMIFTMWSDACISAGLLPPSREHGVKLEDGSSASDYVGKWGAEHEMTKSGQKVGRGDNLTPFQFLDEYGAGDDRYRVKFLEYAEAFKGRKQLVWSRGLRDRLKIGPELTDEQIAENDDPDSKIFGQIPDDVWNVILRREKRAEVLEVCRSGKQAFIDYLINLMVKERGCKNDIGRTA